MQGCLAIQQNGRGEPVVLMCAAGTIAAGRRLTEVGVIRIEASPREAMEDVPLDKILGDRPRSSRTRTFR